MQAFIVWPADEQPCLIVPPALQEFLLIHSGNLPKARKLVRDHMLKKTLTGMRAGQKVWCISLHSLEESTQIFTGAQYERWVTDKLGGGSIR